MAHYHGPVITLVGPLFLSVLDRTATCFQIIQGVLLGIAVLVAGWVYRHRRQRVRMVWHPRKAHLIQAFRTAMLRVLGHRIQELRANPTHIASIPFVHRLDIGLACAAPTGSASPLFPSSAVPISSFG